MMACLSFEGFKSKAHLYDDENSLDGLLVRIDRNMTGSVVPSYLPAFS